MRDEYEIIRTAYEWREGDRRQRETVGIEAPSKASESSYLQEIKRMLQASRGTAKLWEQAAATTSVGTWKRRRAAIKHAVRCVVDTNLERWERRHSAEPLALAGLPRHIEKLAEWLAVAKQEPSCRPFKAKKRKTKIRGLTKLPSDWQEMLSMRMPTYREAVAVATITGCRPAELKIGVSVEVTGNQLTITIRGVKVTKKSGQEWRKLQWSLPSSSSHVALLASSATGAGGVKIIKVERADTFSTAIRDAGDRAWPDHKPRLTAYSLRHAAASEFKNAWGDSDLVSKALGHCASDTKRTYGSSRFNKGAVVPDSVDAARAVKRKVRDRYSPGPSDGDSQQPRQ